MAAEENRLAHFRRLVEASSPRSKTGKPVLSEGYKAVADATGLGYAYIYQVYNSKSGKKGLGAEAVKRISEAFGHGRPLGWMDLPVDDPKLLNAEFEPEPGRPPTLEEAWMALANVFASMDDLGREFALAPLASLAKNPERADVTLKTLTRLVEVHTIAPEDPPPKKPTTAKATASAATRANGKAVLVLKIGGGQKQQFDLPLSRSAFRAESAPAKELAWYDRVRSAPKANDDEKT